LSVLEQMDGVEIVDCSDGAALATVLATWSKDGCALLVDCLYGTGLSQPLRPDGVALVEVLNATPLPKIACDLPSGLDCDTGVPLGGAVRAVRTVSFVGRKLGFDAPESMQYTGEVEVVPIGCPAACWAHVV